MSDLLDLFTTFQKDNKSLDDTDYSVALRKYDIAVCEAIAVSQATAGRYEKGHLGYSTYIFTRLCAHSRALIEATPRNRWVKRDSNSWDLAFTAPQTRAIMEGYLLFSYISEKPESEDEWLTKLNIMHLNDCARRKRLFSNYAITEEASKFAKQETELRERLTTNKFFLTLDAKTQKQALNGKILMIPTRDSLLEKLGIDIGCFNGLFDTLSNHTHVLPMSYYRMTPNGRGTGMINDVELSYTAISLMICTKLLYSATNKMIELFPFAKNRRQGLKSSFSPGPKENRPKKTRHTKYE